MADAINLRRARKAKARADAARKATENRAAHGRTKAEKLLTGTEAERQKSILDGARRDWD
ncbi:MAG: hypothetical protein JWP15_616 [Alphaproteobacteria bacterium]|nr:hypothetical protein [Alphaproteobacteria bacterium]